MRDEFGIVHLQGSVRFQTYQGGSINAGAIFTLPSGFRPAEVHSFTALENGVTVNSIDVGPDGSVALVSGYQDGDWFSLAGISFPAGS